MTTASSATRTYTGGCLCGYVRYEARGEPLSQGYCFCADCRKASGSGFIPFLMFPASSVRFAGETRHSIAKSVRGSDAVRNHCAICGGLVFGGIVGKVSNHSIYGGSLDDPSLFRPTIAIFARDKPDWVLMPPGLEVFATLPGM
ncbi:MAG TPA: GFA family protein [Steroidobacteraceae bacterium]|nr:GFA family protein [Steroidobacteraceae bacterium]